MSRMRQPSLRLSSLEDVAGLRSKAKRRTLFGLLHSDRWDHILLQVTHHFSQAESEEWVGEGDGGLHAQ